MAAHQKYPTVHQQLRELALEARAEGLSFDEFWERALRPRRVAFTWRARRDTVPWGETCWPPRGAVCWPSDTTERQIALEVHRDPVVVAAWRAAYTGQDSDVWKWCGPLAALLDEDASRWVGRDRVAVAA